MQESIGILLKQATADLAAGGNSNPKRDAELLLQSILGLTQTDLLILPERLLTTDELQRFQQAIARRKKSEPIQYILGEREFYGLRFAVTPDVLIPRPETEHLVEAALDRIPADSSAKIADVGTGSGAIAIAIAHHRPLVNVTALDISPAALEVAKANAADHEVADRITFLESDLLTALGNGHFDMIVSNPPYIADSERESLDAEVRDYEPATALFSGPTGLEIYERLLPQAALTLRPEGWLLLEMGAGQQLQLRQLLKDWRTVSFVNDLQGIARVAIARLP